MVVFLELLAKNIFEMAFRVFFFFFFFFFFFSDYNFQRHKLGNISFDFFLGN
jgi:hypothetical protein